ncbi:hypothetical protein GTV32_02540 [Gordonia sp. SID5947]|uniref:hypothetical protein n=1 Tax=Gordonia sp. SID5947 TaxID=2690315 RepID=UPI00136C5D75|nr:hypothetical protein [Gordonia sp. SID5947]MYR05267.1 hypothetical protein [Gordonia sp. SID5947]
MKVDDTRFSYGKLVLYSLGAGVVVLLVAIPVILGVAQWSPIAGLVIALLAVLAMIGVIGGVSRRMIDRAEHEILAARSAQPHPSDPTDRNTSTDG